MEGWFFIIFGFGFIVFVVLVYLKYVKKSNLTPEEKPDYFQNQAQPGQNFVQEVFTGTQLKRDTKLQNLANESSATATEGIRLTTEAEFATLEKEANKPRHEETRELEIAAKETVLTQHKVIQTLANNGLEVGMSADIHQQTKLAQFLSDLKLAEHKEMTGIDLDNRWKEIVQDLDAGDLLVIAARGVINKLEADLKAKRIERYDTETDKSIKKPLKIEMLEDIDNSIEHLKEQINGWRKKETGLGLRQNEVADGQGDNTRYITEGETESE